MNWFLVFIFLPYWLWLFKLGLNLDFQAQDLIGLFRSITQASLSALFSLALGLVCALGLIAIHPMQKKRKLFEGILLIPNLLPVIVTLLSVLQLFPVMPLHLTGVVLVHVILNAGTVGVLLARVMEDKCASSLEAAYVMGTSRLRTWRSILLPMLRNDLVYMFLYVLVICMNSLAVPMILGGGWGTSIEYLIYRTIRVDGDLAKAMGLAMLQVPLLLIFLLVLRPWQRRSFSFKVVNISWLGFRPGLVFGVFLTFLAVGGVFVGIPQALHQWEKLGLSPQFILTKAVNSFYLGCAVSLSLVLLFGLLEYCRFSRLQHRLLLTYIAPPAALLGFGLLLVGSRSDFWLSIKLVFGLMLLLFPSLYRSYWASKRELLLEQREMAELCGANKWKIFIKITWPQIYKAVFFISGLGGFWAVGDFAFAKILFAQDVTLALTIESLMSSYRLELAVLLLWLLMLVGGLVFCVNYSLSYLMAIKYQRNRVRL